MQPQAGLATARTQGKRKDEGTLLNNIGLAYRQLGRMNKALDYYRQALSIREEVGDRAGLAQTLNNISVVYSALSQPTNYPSKVEVYPYTPRNNHRHRSAAAPV